MTSKLLVILPDNLSDVLNKGEVIDRYYNPGDLFDEVHIVLTNEDKPDLSGVARMTGRAKTRVYNLPAGKRLFVRSFGWRPWLLREWAKDAVELARQIRPQLVRCHGAHLNCYAARCIQRDLCIPYIVSLHTKSDEFLGAGWKERLQRIALEKTSRESLIHADRVLAVYEGVTPYLRKIGIRKCDIVYNVLNPRELREKHDYELHQPVRLVSVGRQIEGKNPVNIIRAVREIGGVHLTLVGDGALQEELRKLVKSNGMQSVVTFIPTLANDKLCSALPEFDIFVVHNDYSGVPKAVLEALLSGLPTIANCPRAGAVPELTDDNCLLVDDSVAGYRIGLERVICDSEFRERLGRSAYQDAQSRWAPDKTEAKYVEIYKETLKESMNSMQPSTENRADQ